MFFSNQMVLRHRSLKQAPWMKLCKILVITYRLSKLLF